eukprot:TRINITY_DN1462_c0_g1_i1.p1 TRINITY_DN1462_c0_g1~~TRINITY_DN1462_c0_g1_i1.p1  ORF type:complete len:702 (-),score=150.80 TRINITY_DN1462_c0_g1_i1:493-2598(-)
MSFPLTPAKRSYDRNLESNGKGKWQKSAGFHSQHQPMKISAGSTVFRVLCPASKSGSLIGKGGSIVMQMRQDTGAKISVEEIVPGCTERVVVIVSSDKDAEVGVVQSKAVDENNSISDKGDDVGENDENNEDKEFAPSEDLPSEKAISSAQKALLRVFERMVEGEPVTDEGDEEGKKSASVVVRLLVPSSQVGCIFGRGGSIIKQISADSGAQIRTIPKDKHPPCASPFDELVQITGGLDAVRKALQSVSQQLVESPPRDHDSFPAIKPTGPSSHPFGGGPLPDLFPPVNFHLPLHGAPFPGRPHDVADYHSSVPPSIPKFHESVIPNRMKLSEDILMLKLLCVDEKVGGVIGKGGNLIRTLKHETGCDIKILDGVPDSDDRIIVISGPAHPDDRISAAQDAALRVLSKIVMPVPEKKENVVLSRILVSSNQIGCLLGKGGSVIAEMRKSSGAHIRILGKDQNPKCASENDEVVQIIGEFEAVQEALLQITSRLKHHLFRDKLSVINHLPRPGFSDQGPPHAPFMGRRETSSPPGMYSNLGPSFQKFDSVGGLPPYDDRSAFAHNIHKPGVPPHGFENRASSAPWIPQGVNDVGDGPMGMYDHAGGAPQRRIGGFGGVSQPAIITNTTVEVVVPRALVPSIYGEDGHCLKQIRQISGAKITITEPRPGATETVIIISGTPEETHAAQSLLQAFVLCGPGSP